jgi:quercetin dioxygenase-like cupin family protein
VRALKTFTVSHVPAAPWDVYVTLSSLSSGFWTGPHTHPGPEFGLIVTGQALRWDAGKQRVAKAGDGYFAPAREVHEGGATVDDTLQLSVHLLPKGGAFQTPLTGNDAPAGAPKASPSQVRLFQTTFALASAPVSPFRMVEEIVDFPPGASNSAGKGEGFELVTVAGGRFAVTRNGASSNYGPGTSWTKAATESVAIRNAGNAQATLVVVAFFPGLR